MSTTTPTSVLRVTVGSGSAAHVFEALTGGAKAGELRQGGKAYARALCGKGGELRLAGDAATDCKRCLQIVG